MLQIMNDFLKFRRKNGILMIIGFLLLSSPLWSQDQDTIQSPKEFIISPSLLYRFESGVTSRISFQGVVTYTFHNGLMLVGGLKFHMNENTGLGNFSISAANIPGFYPWMKFRTDLTHLEYPDYLVGENQAAGLVSFYLFRKLDFNAGMIYRAPDFSEEKPHSIFDWNHDANELYPVVNLYWKVVATETLRLTVLSGNYFFMELRTSDHWMAGIKGRYKAGEKLWVDFRALTAVKGISGFVFSVNEFQVNAGITVQL